MEWADDIGSRPAAWNYVPDQSYYASPSSGDAYRDRQLTTNFDLLGGNFLCADMFPNEDSKTVSVCPSVCPYPEKRNHLSFVNISPTLVIDTSMERSSRVLQHENPKCEFHKIKVAKARKNSSVARHFPRLYIWIA